MIRIDEIYNHTFWPWVHDNLPLTRLFFLDPFGSTNPNDLKNFGEDTVEHNYIFMHDQEPIDMALHKNLFDHVETVNLDLNTAVAIGQIKKNKKILIASEKSSDNLDQAIARYDWQPFYYFFHGWASLDWYRGYDKTFLISSPNQRRIQHSFISPNRIIGGQRDHRVLLIYHLLKRRIKHAQISCPITCPQENQSVIDIGRRYQGTYHDIDHILDEANFPWHFEGENDHPMHSCWLSLFEANSTALAHVITETVYFGRRLHLTEKTFKPICLKMPFIMVSSQGSLRYLRSYGFRTFDAFWDESYDDETDDLMRLEKIADLLASLDAMTDNQRQDLYQAMIPVIEHNFQHFYDGAFESILWREFQDMLTSLKSYVAEP